MKFSPDKNKIESIVDKYWKTGRKVLYLNSRRVIDLIGNVPPSEITARAEHILNTPELCDYISDIWVRTASFFARNMFNNIVQRQQKDDDFWEDAYRAYMSSRAAAKAATIARTQGGMINAVIDLVIREAEVDGLSIAEARDRIVYEVTKRMNEIHAWEAERIARTEVIGAANKGSYDGALSSGLEIKKMWLTSGLPGIRPSHSYYESLGFVPMNYSYNIGLQHPGDPQGPPEDIINCRCAIIYNTD